MAKKIIKGHKKGLVGRWEHQASGMWKCPSCGEVQRIRGGQAHKCKCGYPWNDGQVVR